MQSPHPSRVQSHRPPTFQAGTTIHAETPHTLAHNQMHPCTNANEPMAPQCPQSSSIKVQQQIPDENITPKDTTSPTPSMQERLSEIVSGCEQESPRWSGEEPPLVIQDLKRMQRKIRLRPKTAVGCAVRAALLGEHDVIWLSLCSAVDIDGTDQWKPQLETAVKPIAGEYYYQHLPPQLQQLAIKSNMRIFVILVDSCPMVRGLPGGFRLGREWEEPDEPKGGASEFLRHTQLPITVAYFCEDAGWAFQEGGTDPFGPEAEALHYTFNKHTDNVGCDTELWISNFMHECNRIPTTLAHDDGGGVASIIEGSKAIRYFRPADGMLSDGLRCVFGTAVTVAHFDRIELL